MIGGSGERRRLEDVLLTIDCDLGDVAVGGDGGDGGEDWDEDGCCEGRHIDGVLFTEE